MARSLGEFGMTLLELKLKYALRVEVCHIEPNWIKLKLRCLDMKWLFYNYPKDITEEKAKWAC